MEMLSLLPLLLTLNPPGPMRRVCGVVTDHGKRAWARVSIQGDDVSPPVRPVDTDSTGAFCLRIEVLDERDNERTLVAQTREKAAVVTLDLRSQQAVPVELVPMAVVRGVVRGPDHAVVHGGEVHVERCPVVFGNFAIGANGRFELKLLPGSYSVMFVSDPVGMMGRSFTFASGVTELDIELQGPAARAAKLDGGARKSR